jgi:uncharacterized protein (DUF924 family)
VASEGEQSRRMAKREHDHGSLSSGFRDAQLAVATGIGQGTRVSTPDAVLEFWFPSDNARANALWWGKDAQLDAEIRERFGLTLSAAKAGQLDEWTTTARGRVALIIVLDQLSRNIHRGDAKTYEADELARALTLEGLVRGHDRELSGIERLFFYMPLEHSEQLEHQEQCIALMRQLAADVAAEPNVEPSRRDRFASFIDFAVRHRDIVARFGRFPHRNALLGRISSAEELEFLKQPGSSF